MKPFTRRLFLKTCILSSFLPSILFSLENAEPELSMKAYMNGDLDDDLFIIKSTMGYSKMTHCYQMHNPKNIFNYNGVKVDSTPIYGTIQFDETLNIKSSEALVFLQANEREELFDLPQLRARTHFKAVDLKIDNKILIPSLMPENDDVPNYPTWFGNDESIEFCEIGDPSAKNKTTEYNYYKLWENAVCGLGIVIPYSGILKVLLFNKDGKNTFIFEEKIDTKPKNLISKQVKEENFNTHLLAEVDGMVYEVLEQKTDDAYIKNNAITKMILFFDDTTTEIELPYPMPYPNRLYAMSLKEGKK